MAENQELGAQRGVVDVVLGAYVHSLAFSDKLFSDSSSIDEQHSPAGTRSEPADTEQHESDSDDGASYQPEEVESDDDGAYSLVNAKHTPEQYDLFKVRDTAPTVSFYTLFPTGRENVPRSKNRIARQDSQLREFPWCSWYCEGNVNLAKSGGSTSARCLVFVGTM